MLCSHPPKMWALVWNAIFSAKFYRIQQQQNLCCLTPQVCLVAAKSFKDTIIQACKP